MLRYKTERLLRHPARKRSRSMLRTPEPARRAWAIKLTTYFVVWLSWKH